MSARLVKRCLHLPLHMPAFGRLQRSSRAPAVTKPAAPDVSVFAAFFDKYRDSEEDVIEADGIQRLCVDLGISALDPVTLVIAHRCRAKRMGVFTREEFVSGMAALGCENAEKLRARLGELRAVLNDTVKGKEVYCYSFHFALDQGQRCLPRDICIELWKLLLCDHFALLDRWIAFVEERAKEMIPQDTWMMLWDFSVEVSSDLSNYDPDSAWPVLFDEFVEHVRANPKEGVPAVV
uniref:Defective in cullin neddylation protein n=1 Tax=Alexandrium andersonii TaxID=327968 RepID=A0A7S2MZV9_9DINO|mmetsp:Transcript_80036/g.179095  ORF Transcript_80036/g.179095 Transcript_80036/m.179095 type:complete len:236 (+) Transcript_80036:25-732(+)